MISKERLAALEFQAAHNGFTKPVHEAMVRTKCPVNLPHTTMVTITTRELNEFLNYYPKENDDAKADPGGQEANCGGVQPGPQATDQGAVRAGGEAGEAVQAQPEATAGAESEGQKP